MSTGKRLKLEQKVDDREWSNKVAREVIFPEIYERYGPNAEAKMQLPAETLEELRRWETKEDDAEKKPAPDYLSHHSLSFLVYLWLTALYR
ncbi:hypothetical protein CTI12_AA287730 [Artemisia annua]|uniref:Uncharacterized protein n=1 Tax=Artemisia annua TaxID=35608 RepID=A0A2U1MKG5_ARTAN|nr:hypothetical protein CTI12_AA287730 [Artemisia annua]